MPAGRRGRVIPDPETLSPHWRRCGDPGCWLCRGTAEIARIITDSVREARSQEEKERREAMERCYRPAGSVAVPQPTPGRPVMTFEDALDIAYSRCREAMIDRRRKYRWANIDTFNKQELLDKLCRLRNLVFSGKGGQTELDTWVDIANFGVIGILLAVGMWGLPLGDEMEELHERQEACHR